MPAQVLSLKRLQEFFMPLAVLLRNPRGGLASSVDQLSMRAKEAMDVLASDERLLSWDQSGSLGSFLAAVDTHESHLVNMLQEKVAELQWAIAFTEAEQIPQHYYNDSDLGSIATAISSLLNAVDSAAWKVVLDSIQGSHQDEGQGKAWFFHPVETVSFRSHSPGANPASRGRCETCT
jgi:hypothetical protein